MAIVLAFGMLLWNQSASNHYDTVLERKNTLISSAERFEAACDYLTQEVRSYAATGEQIHYDNYRQEVDTDRNRDSVLSDMRGVGLTAGEEAMIRQLNSLSGDMAPVEEQVMTLAGKDSTSEAIILLYSDKYEQDAAQIKEISAKLN